MPEFPLEGEFEAIAKPHKKSMSRPCRQESTEPAPLESFQTLMEK